MGRDLPNPGGEQAARSHLGGAQRVQDDISGACQVTQLEKGGHEGRALLTSADASCGAEAR